VVSALSCIGVEGYEPPASNPDPMARTIRSPRTLAAAAATLLLLGGAWLWLRDSSLVRVEHVTVTGVSGPQAASITDALQTAALDMTTLHVREGALRTAVAPYPIVEGVSASTGLLHSLHIRVRTYDAVGAIVSGGARVAVASNGTLLRGSPTAGLAVIPAKAPPPGDRVRDAATLRLVGLLAAAPPALRDRAQRVYLGSHGLTVPLSRGPVLYFGGAERLLAKWISATRVLQAPSSRGATYVDVRVPERPAAGGLEDPTLQEQQDAPPVLPGATSAPQPGATP
jgi:cell division protein FtsQ